jgi:DNA repair protein RadD
MQLRDYQERGINDIRAQFIAGFRRVCFVAPCGAGKTMVMAYMADTARRRSKRTLFLVHRRELIEQAADTFAGLRIPYGVIAPGYSRDTQLIQIGSVQTVARRLGGLPDPELIILDEAHHSTAVTWLNIIRYFHDARVVGLTATPQRMNGTGLGEIFESLVMGPSAQELIARGYLSPYKYYAPPVTAELDGIRTVCGDFDHTETAFRMDKPKIIGDAIEHYQKYAAGTQAIAYCAGRQHSIHTAASFRAAGIPARHVDSKTPGDERRQAMLDFRMGRIRVLTNCDLFGEGVDVPQMETVIMLRPTKSLTLYIQQSMRGMRTDRSNPDKCAIILDHVGNVMRHGLPDTERTWTLAGKKHTRKQAAPEVKIRVCPNCYSVSAPADSCPYCGFQYPPMPRNQLAPSAGELKEFTLAKIEELRRRRTEVGRASSVEELQHIAEERGYKPGWVRIQARLRGIG